MAQQWHDQAGAPPSKNSRRPLVIAAVFGAFLLLAAAATWWIVRPSTDDHVAVPTATVTVTASPETDDATLDACSEAKMATRADDPGDKHAKQARSWAQLSDVDTLREIAARYPAGAKTDLLDSLNVYTAALEISTWCVQHGLQ